MGNTKDKSKSTVTECSICMNTYIDPRMLPCVHTFCFECLKRTAEAAQKKPGDKMPCPCCKKEFLIPKEGIVALQRNFSMERFMEMEGSVKSTFDSIDYFFNIRTKSDEEMKFCTEHGHKPLDYFCADCKEIVCVSCFDKSHKLHDCKDVTAFEKEFRKKVEIKTWKIPHHVDEILSLKWHAEIRRTDFLNKIAENETAIIKRSQELKDMIDKDTETLLDELSVIKSGHLKDMEGQVEAIDIHCTILRSFEAYCIALSSKGSVSDICRSLWQITDHADNFETIPDELIAPLYKSIEVSFEKTDLTEQQMDNNNFVGQIKETTTQYENCAILVGIDNGPTITKDVIKINLHRPNEIATQAQIPTAMAVESVAAVYGNTMYVTGIGAKKDEIWKYNMVSGWMRCTSLVQGRRRHSAAFIDKVLYICGGFVDSDESSLDSVEAFNAVNNKCTTVGKLLHCVHNSGNCVPFKGSLYIFGGADKDNRPFNHVQVYNTKENTCSVLSRPMPRPYNLMRAVLCETSVILLGWDTCFIYNFETETWQERKQFKAEAAHFGLVLENGRIFVIGGGTWKTDKNGAATWICRDDVRYVPLQNILDDKHIEWKIHGKLPKPSLVHACANMHVLA